MTSNFPSLEAFAAEIERVEKQGKDYVVDSQHMYMVNPDTIAFDAGISASDFDLTDLAHGQLAEKLGIPKPYYDRIKEIPFLREHNVDELLKARPNSLMIRTLDGQARAILSDKYKRVDNAPVLRTIFPIIREAVDSKEVAIRSYSLSPTKMRFQVAFPKVQGEVKKGDVVQGGVTFSNSEVGMGMFEIQAWVERLVCSNGLMLPSVLKKRHVGGRVTDDALDGFEFRRETIEAEQRAVGLVSRDIMQSMLKGDWFAEQLAKMRESSEDAVVRPATAIERTVKLLGLPEGLQDPLLNSFASAGDMSRWGVVNSLTAFAKGFENPDKQAEFEVHGATILNLPAKEWERIVA